MLLAYLKIDWAQKLQPPKETRHRVKRISKENLQETLNYFSSHKHFKQLKALIYLGATSGLRPWELYQLKPEDIDIEKRTIYVNHNPRMGQTTKTGKSRVSFFTKEAQKTLIDYMKWFATQHELICLFGQKTGERAFRKAPIKVKDLRKFFSQEWERQSGSYAVKEILLGHSLKKSVDLQHYTVLDERDLKKIYDRVGIRIS